MWTPLGATFFYYAPDTTYGHNVLWPQQVRHFANPWTPYPWNVLVQTNTKSPDLFGENRKQGTSKIPNKKVFELQGKKHNEVTKEGVADGRSETPPLETTNANVSDKRTIIVNAVKSSVAPARDVQRIREPSPPAIRRQSTIAKTNATVVQSHGDKVTLLLQPIARAVAKCNGTAIAAPFARAVVDKKTNADIIFRPDAVAVAGPGGIAHAQSELEIGYFEKIQHREADMPLPMPMSFRNGGASGGVKTETLPFYGGARGQVLQIYKTPDGRIVSSQVKQVGDGPSSPNYYYHHVANNFLAPHGDVGFTSELERLYTNAGNLIALQQHADRYGGLRAEDTAKYGDSVAALNDAATNLQGVVPAFGGQPLLSPDTRYGLYYVPSVGRSELMGVPNDVPAQIQSKIRIENEENETVEENTEGNEEGGEEEGGQEGGDDGVAVELPPEGSSIAEVKPVALAIAGPGGVAASKPVGTAIVGPGGLAISRPVATAISGVPPSQVGLPLGSFKQPASNQPATGGGAGSGKDDKERGDDYYYGDYFRRSPQMFLQQVKPKSISASLNQPQYTLNGQQLPPFDTADAYHDGGGVPVFDQLRAAQAGRDVAVPLYVLDDRQVHGGHQVVVPHRPQHGAFVV